jgi:hypothetical protein
MYLCKVSLKDRMKDRNPPSLLQGKKKDKACEENGKIR